MAIEIRPVRDEAEFHRFHVTEERAFGSAAGDEKRRDQELTVLPLDRTVAAFDGDALVGTAGSYAFDMTVPGGSTVPVAGVTAVAVSSTHRRRGVLRQMMDFQLDDVAARNEPMAILNASEAAIYGRFGYGLAEFFMSLNIDVRMAAFARPIVERSVPMRLLDRDQALEVLPGIYDECRPTKPGMLSQSTAWWECVLGEIETWKGGGDRHIVAADPDPANGTGGGFAIYQIDNMGQDPGYWQLDVRVLHAADPVVEAQLWRHLLDVDLMGTVLVESVPLDHPLRWLLANTRAARVTRERDFLWLRLLDIEHCLNARAYPVADELVIEVFDPFRPMNSGCYAVKGGPDGGSCQRTEQEPDLTMDVEDLGAIYLGGVRPSWLAGADRITEAHAGALERADLFFGWPVYPVCTTRF